MVRPLKERFADVQATDVHDYGFGFGVRDFLWVDRWMEDPDDYIQPDWIITNPPFRLGKEFALAAFQRAKIGCALLVRTAFLEGGDRYRSLYQARRPHYVFQFVERLPMVKGRCDPDASTATSYAWLVWLPCEIAAPDTIFDWIPPCRAKLEKPGDYRAMEPD